LNKRIAVIVLIAILAISSCMLLGIPKAKADMTDVKILSYSTYVSPADSYTSYAGDFIVVGEIQNQGTEIFNLPQITAVAYTSDGTPLASSGSSAYVKDLLPGQKAPFYIDFTTDSADPNGNYSGTLGWIPVLDHVSLSLWAENATDTMYRGLVVAGSTSYSVGGVYSVTGYIQNTGGNLTGNVWAVTTFYNSTGGVVAANYTVFLTHSLAPNASVPFTATPMDNTPALSSEITSYSVIVQNMDYQPPASTTPTPTSAVSTPTPVVTQSTQPTASPSPQGGSDTLLYAGIGVVVIVVAIAAMLFIRKRRS